MLFYHRTTEEAAEAILATGFKDATDYHLTDSPHSGVWLSEVPLDSNEGCKGNALLTVEVVISDDEFRAYEWVEKAKPYREWLVPAALLNGRATIRLIDEHSDEGPASRFLPED